MKVSYQWLQRYFDAPLPKPEKLAQLLTFHSFEVEGIESFGKDSVIDVDVLPNRSSDCLSHRGIARDIATILNVPMTDDPLGEEIVLTPASKVFSATVDDPELCRRFSAVVIEEVNVRESPEWLKQAIEALGQKPINNIVDATNYVMFSLGQPLHAFDRDKLTKQGDYNIRVRVAGEGEKITTLTGESYVLNSSVQLITDGKNDEPIGIAGIKGGKKAEIDADSKNLVIEAANFHPTQIRRASQFLKMRTDASTRFENEPAQELTAYALHNVVDLILDIAGGQLEGYFDWWPTQQEPSKINITLEDINNYLGTTMSKKDVIKIYERFNFKFIEHEGTFTVTAPFERLDLTTKAELIEEVGRIHGYSNIDSIQPPKLLEPPAVNKRFYYAEKIRSFLKKNGFSEIYNNTFRDKGVIQMQNALASNKSWLRDNLSAGMVESLKMNAHNADLLGIDVVRTFEFGTVFSQEREHISFCLGMKRKKKGSPKVEEIISKVISGLSEMLGVPLKTENRDGVVELNFSELLEVLPEQTHYIDFSPSRGTITYAPISSFPFVLRDIAMWAPSETKKEDIESLILNHAGDLLVHKRLFDVYEKDDQTSYAFHLVFQSHEKTLSDEEINGIMEKVTVALVHNKCTVR